MNDENAIEEIANVVGHALKTVANEIEALPGVDNEQLERIANSLEKIVDILIVISDQM